MIRRGIELESGTRGTGRGWRREAAHRLTPHQQRGKAADQYSNQQHRGQDARPRGETTPFPLFWSSTWGKGPQRGQIGACKDAGQGAALSLLLLLFFLEVCL